MGWRAANGGMACPACCLPPDVLHRLPPPLLLSRRCPKPLGSSHLSGMERMRWLNSFLALMVRPLAGWCAARRMSWSQKEFISAAF